MKEITIGEACKALDEGKLIFEEMNGSCIGSLFKKITIMNNAYFIRSKDVNTSDVHSNSLIFFELCNRFYRPAFTYDAKFYLVEDE